MLPMIPSFFYLWFLFPDSGWIWMKVRRSCTNQPQHRLTHIMVSFDVSTYSTEMTSKYISMHSEWPEDRRRKMQGCKKSIIKIMMAWTRPWHCRWCIVPWVERKRLRGRRERGEKFAFAFHFFYLLRPVFPDSVSLIREWDISYPTSRIQK